MAGDELLVSLRGLNGVIEAAVFPDAEGRPVEIQIWTGPEVDERYIRQAVADLLGERGMIQYNERVYVFELTREMTAPPPQEVAPVVPFREQHAVEPKPESMVWEQETTASEDLSTRGRRPKIGKINLSASGADTQANISLVYGGQQADGVGTGPKTPYSLRVTAATTLEAAQALLGEKGVFTLQGVSLVEILGQRAVMVVAETTLGGGRKLLGACLVGETQVHEATVRAALDAVNRQLELALP